METPTNKIMNLIDKLPEEERAIIAKAYYQKSEKDMSPKVMKLKKVFDKLNDEEKHDFIKCCGGRMIDPFEEKPMGMGVVITTESSPEGEETPEEE